MFWLHLSDEFLSKHPINRASYGEHVFLFKDRQTDIFTAWGGEANFRDFILNGVSGLSNPTILENGLRSGEIQGFKTALDQGNADFEGGFYLTDQQVLKTLEAFQNYPGREKGYSFIRRISEKLNAPYEPSKAQAVNGYNCGDFAFHVINASGAMSKDMSEALKVRFWYPKKYWDQPIPLLGSGRKIYQKFSNHRDDYMSRDEILGIAWFELFFTTLRIFDQKAMVDEVTSTHPDYYAVRIWNQENVIKYLQEPGHVDFRSKRVIEDLLPAVIDGTRIDSPLPVRPDVWRFKKSKSHRIYTKVAQKKMIKKRERAGLTEPEVFSKYKALEESLKTNFSK
jgi:hypothetical protein